MPLPDFGDVVSGGSNTTVSSFVETYGDLPILGDNDWWFNHTLNDYVADFGVGWPPYGVIVAPRGIDHLVWFDASGVLHVIDLSKVPNGKDVAISVKQPEYFEDPRYLELWQETLKPLVPTVPDIKQMLFMVLGIGVVVLAISRRF
jgi:hypothetical protein